MDLFNLLAHLGGALCHIGTRLVKLAGLSCKSNCNIYCIWEFIEYSFSCYIPMSSLQYQLIGKLLGSVKHPISELDKIDLIIVL